MTPPRIAERASIERIVGLLFIYAEAGTFVSLRAFDQLRRDGPAKLIQAVEINGDLSPLVERATAAATWCVTQNSPIVFAPPICTFNNPRQARGVDLANGLTISAELDRGNTHAARQQLEFLLGPATLVVASGGEWTDPETGEVFPKLHLHWRLSEPTKDQASHTKLAQARDLAATLVGADPTGKAVVHPMRWPGSWNCKAEPRLARILAENEDAEVHLDEALAALTEAMEAAGLDAVKMPRSSDPQAPPGLVASAMAAIPNPNRAVVPDNYALWIRLGYACYRACGGDAGFEVWDTWSRKSDKYDAGENEAAWQRIRHAIEGSTAPITAGAGSIFWHAWHAGWTRPLPDPPPYWEESGARQEAPGPAEADIPLEPKLWVKSDPTKLEPRHWLVGTILLEGYATVLGGTGGTGKTAFAIALGLSVITGHWRIMQETVFQRGKVWFICLEDDELELEKRLHAALLAHSIPPEDIEGRLYINSGQERPLVLAKLDEGGNPVPTLDADAVEQGIRRDNIELTIIDPLIKAHRVIENRNEHMDMLQTLCNRVAYKTGRAVLLVHHFRKGGGEEGHRDAFRGGGSLIDSTRLARGLVTMTAGEAEQFGISTDEAFRYIRLVDAKANLAPKHKATWFMLKSVELGNYHVNLAYPNGDNVQAAVPWEPPPLFADMDHVVLRKIFDQLRDGPGNGWHYGVRSHATHWAGSVIMEATDKTQAQARDVLKTWLKSKALTTEMYEAPNRKQMERVIPDFGKVAVMVAALRDAYRQEQDL